MPWPLVFTQPWLKDWQELSVEERNAIAMALFQLSLDPRQVDLKKLQGRKDQWRLRVGQRRIIIEKDDKSGVFYVLRILPRSEAYR